MKNHQQKNGVFSRITEKKIQFQKITNEYRENFQEILKNQQQTTEHFPEIRFQVIRLEYGNADYDPLIFPQKDIYIRQLYCKFNVSILARW